MENRGNVAVWIFAMVVAGLIVYAIVSPQFHDQIGDWFEGLGGSDVLGPDDIRDHPSKYLGETVTIEGYYSGGWAWPTKDIGTQEEAIEAAQGMLELDLPENAQVFEGEKYRFTGVVEREGGISDTIPILVVSDIEPV